VNNFEKIKKDLSVDSFLKMLKHKCLICNYWEKGWGCTNDRCNCLYGIKQWLLQEEV
jgi:hypothetical protein